jgi:5'-nucleotidase
MRILITNDDGIHAPGLLALRGALSNLGEVVAIAPERPRSACGHSITLHKPLRLIPVELPGGDRAYASNGTPADCVALGVSDHLGAVPDLVVSGINLGPNLGVDMTYSGTVAAAMEAAIGGIPSFAISVAAYDAVGYEPAAEFARYLAEAVAERGLPRGSLLNVNVPPVRAEEIRGVAITCQGRIRYSNRIERRTDPRGGDYYWLTGERVEHSPSSDSDVDAIAERRISVTPVSLELTDQKLLASMPGWNLRWPG